MEVPENKVEWIEKWRKGEVENIYDTFDCDEEECKCEFGNLADLLLHDLYGTHGRMGDRFAEQNRRKFKYFTRMGRVKHDIYKEESRSIEQENNGSQGTLK